MLLYLIFDVYQLEIFKTIEKTFLMTDKQYQEKFA